MTHSFHTRRSSDLLALKAGLGHPMSPRMNVRYVVTEFSQFKCAQMIADKYGLTREDMDQYSLASHRKATAATAAGAFEREILPIAITDAQGDPAWHVADDGIRRDATIEAIRCVRQLAEGGAITAANGSQIAAGSAAVLDRKSGGLGKRVSDRVYNGGRRA